MRHQFLLLFLFCLFAFGNTSFAAENSNCLELDGGAEAVIFDGKTGQILVNFQLPDKYLDIVKGISLPLNIVISNNKMAVFSTVSTDFSIIIPENLSGDYLISIKIGELNIERRIRL